MNEGKEENWDTLCLGSIVGLAVQRDAVIVECKKKGCLIVASFDKY